MTTAPPSSDDAARAMEIAKQLTGPWQERNEQWVRDRRLLTMRYRERVKPFEQILTNDIAVQHSFAISIMAGKEPVFRMPISVQEEEERERMNRSERLIAGIWRETDRDHRSQGHDSLLHDMLSFGLLGAVCIFPYLELRPRRQPLFHVAVYDPMNCYGEFGENGLLRFARVYNTTFQDAYALCLRQGWETDGLVPPSPSETPVPVYNVWECEYGDDGEAVFNTVVIGGRAVKPRTQHDEFNAIPVIFAPMNGLYLEPAMVPFTLQPGSGQPSYSRGGSQDWGRPIFWMNRELVPALDRNLSYSAEISRKTAYGKYKYFSEGGLAMLSPQEWEQTMVLNLDPSKREDITALETPSAPRERETLMQSLEQRIERGGLSRLAMGMLDMEISGVTLERASTQARGVLEPYLTGMQGVLSQVMMSFLGQLKKGKVRKLSLVTRAQELGPEMGYMVEDYTAEDIPTTPYVEVTLPMSLPDNRLMRLNMARIAKPGNEPLLPDRIIREEILQVQDEGLMKRLFDEEASENSSAMRAVRQMAAQRRLIKEWQESGVRTPEEIEEAQLALAVMREGFRTTMAPREQPAVTLQPRQSEPPPEVRSPEESGMPPAMADLIAGQTSTVPQPATVREDGRQNTRKMLGEALARAGSNR